MQRIEIIEVVAGSLAGSRCWLRCPWWTTAWFIKDIAGRHTW